MSDAVRESEQLVISVDSQELTSMNLCRERWRLEFIEHWRPNYKPKAMELGTIMHAMLAHYYRNRADRVDKQGKVHKARLEPQQQAPLVEECLHLGRVLASNSPLITPEIWDETLDRVFKEYILWYQYDNWEVLSVEKPFSVTLYESPRLLIMYTGITDLIVRDIRLGEVVVDTKTEARRSDPILLNNQFQGYHFASGGRPVVINKIGWQKDSTPIEKRFRRIELYYDESMQREWVNDAIRQVIESIEWKKDIDKGKRMMKNRSSCDKFGGCVYRKICQEPPEVREHKLIADFKRKVWDPHERDAAVIAAVDSGVYVELEEVGIEE